MININTSGLFVDAEFLMNYKSYNLSGEEAMFLLQISYLTEQGKKVFSASSFSEALGRRENEIFSLVDSLLKKNVLSLAKDNKLQFVIFEKDSEHYTLKELLKIVERLTSKVLTSKEIDIISSWHDKKYTKREIDEALNMSRNISYVNGILSNKVEKPKQQDIKKNEGAKTHLGYDWFNK